MIMESFLLLKKKVGNVMSWFIDFPNEVFPLIIQDLKEAFVVSLFWFPVVLFVAILVRVIIYFF